MSDWLNEMDFKARVFVCGLVKHEKTGDMIPNTGHWHARFRGHPWVEQAEAQGWGKELRSTVTLAVKRLLMAKKPVGAIEELMPDSKWVAAAVEQAERAVMGAMWQRENPQKVTGLDKRFTFRPLNDAGNASLSETSKRMTGDRA